MKKCSLCGTNTSKIINSHFLPASIYRELEEQDIQRRIQLLNDKNKIFRMGKDITRKHLCDACEDLFSKNGENFFKENLMIKKSNTENCIQPNIFNKIINKIAPNTSYEPNYLGNFLDKEDEEKIIYFILSMFWRGTLDWPQYKSIHIPEKANEEIKSFLLGNNNLIKGIKIYVDIINIYSVLLPARMPKNLTKEVLVQIIESFRNKINDNNVEKISEKIYSVASVLAQIENSYFFNIQQYLFRLEIVEDNKGEIISYGRNNLIDEVFRFIVDYIYELASKSEKLNQ